MAVTRCFEKHLSRGKDMISAQGLREAITEPNANTDYVRFAAMMLEVDRLRASIYERRSAAERNSIESAYRILPARWTLSIF